LLTCVTFDYGRLEQEKNTFSYYNTHAQEFAFHKRKKKLSHYWSKELTYFKALLQNGTRFSEVVLWHRNESFLLNEIGIQLGY